MVSPPNTKDIINWRRGAGNDLKLIEVKVLEELAKMCMCWECWGMAPIYMCTVLMIPSGTTDCGFDKSVIVHCGLRGSRGLGWTSEGLGSVGDSYTNL